MNTVSRTPTQERDILMADGSAAFAYSKGLKSSSTCTIVVFLIGILKDGFGLADSVGFGFGGLLAADEPVVVAGETLCSKLWIREQRTHVKGGIRG